MSRVLWPENLFRTESGKREIKFVVQTFACSRKVENEEFWCVTFADGICLKFVGFARGWSLSPRIPLWQRIWLVETIRSLYRESYKHCFCHRAFPQNVRRKENPRHGDTCWSIIWVSFDGLRWSCASIELNHKEMIWVAQKIYSGRKVVSARSSSCCKNCIFQKVVNENFDYLCPRGEHLSKICRPCRGLLVGRSHPRMTGEKKRLTLVKKCWIKNVPAKIVVKGECFAPCQRDRERVASGPRQGRKNLDKSQQRI